MKFDIDDSIEFSCENSAKGIFLWTMLAGFEGIKEGPINLLLNEILLFDLGVVKLIQKLKSLPRDQYKLE